MRLTPPPRQMLAACALALLFSVPLAYAPPPAPRLALVVGNSKHQDQRLGVLKTAHNDAEDVAKGLGLSGYQVTSQFDGDLGRLHEAFASFADKLKSDGFRDAVAVVYFAGYGMQKGGRNFLLPVSFDASNESQDLDKSAIPVDRDILSPLSGRRGGANVIILDACRDDPFGQRQGLAQIDQVPNGTLVELAAEPNAQSIESLDPKAPERNGVYAKQLLKKLERPNPDLDIRQFFDMVGNNVYEASNKAQKPRVMTAQTPPALPERLSLAAENAKATATSQESRSWRRVEKSTEACAFEQHLKRFPDGEFADSARAAIQAINAKTESAPRAFADLPQDLKAQVTRSFQAKQAAAAAECARKWAVEGVGRKGYGPAYLRRGAGFGQGGLATREISHPSAGMVASVWRTDPAALRPTAFQPAAWNPASASRPIHKAGNPYPRNLMLASEEDQEASPADEAAGSTVGDAEFQADLLQAGQGEINAMFRVALVYEEGSHGVEKDETESMHWLALSSSLGNGLASYKLYRYFAAQASGYAKAVKYKSLASRQGYYGPVTLEAER